MDLATIMAGVDLADAALVALAANGIISEGFSLTKRFKSNGTIQLFLNIAEKIISLYRTKKR